MRSWFPLTGTIRNDKECVINIQNTNYIQALKENFDILQPDRKMEERCLERKYKIHLRNLVPCVE